MKGYIESFFKVKGNFLEEFLVKFGYLFLIILGIALTFLVFDKYYIFLNFLFLPFILLLIVFVALFVFFNRKEVKFKKNKIDYLIIGFVLLFCVFNAFHFSEYAIDGGHDTGVYFETAILLSKTGSCYQDSLEKPFLLSFPGYFPYNNNLTRAAFMPGNSTYFSIFYHLFGLNGFPIGLSLSLFLSTVIIYFLCKRIRNWQTGFLFLIFFLFNYYTIYFSRAPWVENLQLLLVWFYIYLFLRGFQSKKLSFIFYASLPLSLLMLFRLETLLYIPIYLILVFCLCFIKKFNFKFDKKTINISTTILVILFSTLIIANAFVFDSSMILFGPESSLQTIIKTIQNPRAKIAWGPQEFVPYNQQIFLSVFLFYAFGPIFFLITSLSLINFFQENKRMQIIILLISFLILPQFIFLIRPSIQVYLNWAMRRFWGIFIPYIFLLFALFLTNPNNFIRKTFKNLFIPLATLIAVISLSPGLSIINLAEGGGILNYEKEVASHFQQTDAVIFWDRIGYEYWGPPLFFLHNTNVIFDQAPAFDREIYALFMKDYKNLYIATSHKPNESLYGYFEGRVKYIKTIKSPVFKILARNSCHLGKFAVQPETFESYSQIADLCTKDNPQTKTVDYQIDLNIYKIDDSFKNEFIEKYYNPDYKITRSTKRIFAGGEED